MIVLQSFNADAAVDHRLPLGNFIHEADATWTISLFLNKLQPEDRIRSYADSITKMTPQLHLPLLQPQLTHNLTMAIACRPVQCRRARTVSGVGYQRAAALQSALSRCRFPAPQPDRGGADAGGRERLGSASLPALEGRPGTVSLACLCAPGTAVAAGPTCARCEHHGRDGGR